MTDDRSRRPANVEVIIDQRAKKASQRLLRSHAKRELCNNFVTPLPGTFLNLPREPITLKCPSCGQLELTHTVDDPKWWAIEINRCWGCLFL